MWMMNQSDGDLGAAPAAATEKRPEQAHSLENTAPFSEFKLLVDEQTPQ
jgi:hypothetical protein